MLKSQTLDSLYILSFSIHFKVALFLARYPHVAVVYLEL